MKEDLLKIINNYGVIPQLKHFNSEVFELTEAIINHEWLKERGLENKNHITEEIADCLVMINQFVEYYEIQESDIYMIMEQKIDRTISRIEEDEFIDVEKLKIGYPEDNPSNKYIVNEYGTKCYLTKHSRIMADKINDLIKNQKKIIARLDKSE